MIFCQADWIQDFLEEYKFNFEFINPFEIMEVHDQYKYLLTISDGSVVFHNTSFGWVLATPNGDLFAYRAGPCNGRGSSLCSEGARMLTVTIFMSLILEFTGKDGAKLQYISEPGTYR